MNWSSESRPPPDPFQPIDCTVTGPPPKAPHTVSSPHGERCELIPNADAHAARMLDHGGSYFRDSYWHAFTVAAQQANARHAELGGKIESFRHAEKDLDLNRLGFIMPSKDWTGDVATLAGQQEVPEGQGARPWTVCSTADDQLRLNDQDQQGIDAAAASDGEHGSGDVENDHHRRRRGQRAPGAVRALASRPPEVKPAADNVAAATAEIESPRLGEGNRSRPGADRRASRGGGAQQGRRRVRHGHRHRDP